MARHVFFSFHYQRDIFRVNIVRNSGIVIGSAAAGFHDASLWEETKRQGDDAVKRLIDRGLEGTSVTAVLIGAETANRKFVDYEIEQSIKRGNGLLGIYIHGLADVRHGPDFQGAVPWRLIYMGAPIYHWDRNQFGEWVEQAYQRSQEGQVPYAGLGNFLSTLGSYQPLPPPPPYNPSNFSSLAEILKRYSK